MRKPLLSALGLVAFSLAALAVGDIPTRYSGSFPSDGVRQEIVGTFTGKALRFAFTPRRARVRRTFAGNCAAISSTQTRCSGTIRGSGGDQFTARADVVVTWSAGRPAAISISK
jgi:hypothetical protein